MKYHDTGTKEAKNTLAQWFSDVLNEEVTAFRMQSGYFRLGAAKALMPVLARAAGHGVTTHLVLGSNDADTLHSDVSRLFAKLEMPRDTAKLAIVQFSNALFHPKVYHITRQDGTQAAFVGSANFTETAITGGNVEAAVSLDTRLDAPVHILNEIASAVDHWLLGEVPPGSWNVSSQADIDALLENGILAKQRPQRQVRGQTTATQTGGKPAARRAKLIVLPSWPDIEPDVLDDQDIDHPSDGSVSEVALPVSAIYELAELPALTVKEPDGSFELSVETREGFPAYIQFEPGAEAPTSGWTALSGAKLTEPYVGLIMRLTKDSARHFSGGQGTANISIPVAVAKTFRFGVYPNSGRPRAEFSLQIRYHASALHVEQSVNTNVMAYGVLTNDTGHGDLRMVLPAAVKEMAGEIAQNGLPLPTNGDLFLMEWPSEDFEHFRITFLEPGCLEHTLVEQTYLAAAQENRLMGGSCGLTMNISPHW